MAGVQFIGGLALLVVGAELLVRGASRVATSAGLPPLVIGLTIVAFGTSTPELAVSVKAALADQSALSLGNAVGSNIFNVLAILGMSAMVTPLAVSSRLVRVEVPIMIAVSALVFLLASDGVIGRLDGAILFAGIVVYTGVLLFAARRAVPPEQADETSTAPVGKQGVVLSLLLAVAGLVILVVGAQLLVDSAVVFAKALGMSDVVIGLTIVAAGTSLPEAFTSVVASLRGERDLAVGNIVGSNIFNLLAVIGAAGLCAPHGIAVAPAVLHFDLPVMVAATIACLPIFFTGMQIARWEGALLLSFYVAYVAYLVLDATNHQSLPAFSAAMLWFVLPITAGTLLALALQPCILKRTRIK